MKEVLTDLLVMFAIEKEKQTALLARDNLDCLSRMRRSEITRSFDKRDWESLCEVMLRQDFEALQLKQSLGEVSLMETPRPLTCFKLFVPLYGLLLFDPEAVFTIPCLLPVLEGLRRGMRAKEYRAACESLYDSIMGQSKEPPPPILEGSLKAIESALVAYDSLRKLLEEKSRDTHGLQRLRVLDQVIPGHRFLERYENGKLVDDNRSELQPRWAVLNTLADWQNSNPNDVKKQLARLRKIRDAVRIYTGVKARLTTATPPFGS